MKCDLGHRRVRALLLAFSCSLVAGSASADVVTVGPIKDNTVYEEDGALSNGAGQHLFTGQTKDDWWRRAFIAFDIASAVPAGSDITGVTLTLYVNRSKSDSLTVGLHKVTADWGEGVGGAGRGGRRRPGDAG